MGRMQSVRNAVRGMKAVLMMVTVQTTMAGVVIPYKMVLTGGMSISVLVAYRFIFATAFMAPLIVERKSRQKLTWKVTAQAFLCGLLGGSMFQNLYLEGLVLTSLTYAAAMGNLILGIQSVFATFFRLEKLRLGTMAGKAKVVGTLVGIGAAMVLTFYKGPEIHLWETHINLSRRTATTGHSVDTRKSGDMVLGFVFAFCSCVCFALSLIQAKMSASYPAPYSSTTLLSFMGTIQAVAYALYREKHRDQWRLGWNIRLFAVIYADIVVSGLNMVLTTWCVRMKGPLFVSFFNPLVVVIVALLASQTLDEKLHLGSVLGVVLLIVCGFYLVLWAKSKQKELSNRSMPSTNAGELPNHTHPLEIVILSPKVSGRLLKDGGGVNDHTIGSYHKERSDIST